MINVLFTMLFVGLSQALLLFSSNFAENRIYEQPNTMCGKLPRLYRKKSDNGRLTNGLTRVKRRLDPFHLTM